jgi:hypothetical protein
MPTWVPAGVVSTNFPVPAVDRGLCPLNANSVPGQSMAVVAAGRQPERGMAERLQAPWLLHALLHPPPPMSFWRRGEPSRASIRLRASIRIDAGTVLQNRQEHREAGMRGPIKALVVTGAMLARPFGATDARRHDRPDDLGGYRPDHRARRARARRDRGPGGTLSGKCAGTIMITQAKDTPAEGEVRPG